MLKIHSGKVGKVVVRVPSYPNECYDSVKRLMTFIIFSERTLRILPRQAIQIHEHRSEGFLNSLPGTQIQGRIINTFQSVSLSELVV